MGGAHYSQAVYIRSLRKPASYWGLTLCLRLGKRLSLFGKPYMFCLRRCLKKILMQDHAPFLKYWPGNGAGDLTFSIWPTRYLRLSDILPATGRLLYQRVLSFQTRCSKIQCLRGGPPLSFSAILRLPRLGAHSGAASLYKKCSQV